MLNFEASHTSVGSLTATFDDTFTFGQTHHDVDASNDTDTRKIETRAATLPSAPGIAGLQAVLLQAVLDQVDYGMAVVDTETHQLIFANAQALCALPTGDLHDLLDLSDQCSRGLRVAHGRLCTQDDDQADQLNTALAKTKTRVRSLLRLTGYAGQELTIAVMPLSGFDGADAGTTALTATLAASLTLPHSPPPNYALLVFAKQQLCDNTSVTLFARERGLTSAEGQVLAHVCKGLRPAQIATHQGVQVSTVRTQLRAIRQKTASDSMRQLVQKVSSLPPLARYMPSFMSGPQRSVTA